MTHISKPELKELTSGIFFVKQGEHTLGGFHNKEHAELFLKALSGDMEREAAKRAWKEGVDALSLLISGRDIVLTGELKNPYSLPYIEESDWLKNKVK